MILVTWRTGEPLEITEAGFFTDWMPFLLPNQQRQSIRLDSQHYDEKGKRNSLVLHNSVTDDQ